MCTIPTLKATALIKLLLLVATVQFTTTAAAVRPAGVRTAIELLDRRWMAPGRFYAVKLVVAGQR